MKNFQRFSMLLITIIILAFVSGCACNKNFAEGFWKGAAIGAVVGGTEGYLLTNDANQDGKNTAIGAGIGGFITGMIMGFTNKCDEVVAAEPAVVDLDSDGDGVVDRLDQCPDTPAGVKVDYKGCPADTDGDGVTDDKDRCPGTPRGVKVDYNGCPLDSDGDGVTDDKDRCPDTPRGVKVDSRGCPVSTDADGDGVLDEKDQCPNTPKGAKVNEVGCWVLEDIIFDFDKAKLKSEFYSQLDEIVYVLKQQPDLKVEIQGHTCNIGSDNYNMSLSERRAKAVVDYLVSKGIDRARLKSKGYGETKPLASNDTKEGRKLNRRAQIEPIM